jgi:hypothetical protein
LTQDFRQMLGLPDIPQRTPLQVTVLGWVSFQMLFDELTLAGMAIATKEIHGM